MRKTKPKGPDLVAFHTAWVDDMLARHERELESLADRVRDVVVSVCRRFRLQFTSGMGVFFFERRAGKSVNERTYGCREDLNQSPPHDGRALSAKAKEALGPVLDLLNKPLSPTTCLGHFVGDVE